MEIFCKIDKFIEGHFLNNGKGNKSQNKIVTLNPLIHCPCVYRIETPKSASEFNLFLTLYKAKPNKSTQNT